MFSRMRIITCHVIYIYRLPATSSLFNTAITGMNPVEHFSELPKPLFTSAEIKSSRRSPDIPKYPKLTLISKSFCARSHHDAGSSGQSNAIGAIGTMGASFTLHCIRMNDDIGHNRSHDNDHNYNKKESRRHYFSTMTKPTV